MGEGDHGPIIAATVAEIRKDLENLKLERDVYQAVRDHFLGTLRALEKIHGESPAELKPEVRIAISRMTEVYDAMFAPVEPKFVMHKELPAHLKRAEVILATLEENDA